MRNIDIFLDFLQREFPLKANKCTPLFQDLHREITAINSRINIISRKMDPADYWIRHYLDSLLAAKSIDFSGKNTLDFGTGGGFPGLPLAILFPDAHFTLLDSRKKKLTAIEEVAANCGIHNIETLHTRIEDAPATSWGSFDIITCRSVRILPKFRTPLLRLLKPEGLLCFYKAKETDDMAQFSNTEYRDESNALLGTRKIILSRREK
ncbi:MAG: 16S rRNA (guanine(527)-N(7))-methyltransferase RsmG [Fibrobacterota bacterium]